MIIFGLREKAMFAAELPTSCSHCQESSQSVVTFQKYLHIFWIPFIGLWKTARVVCTHCKKVSETKVVNHTTAIEIKNARKAEPLLWKWAFSGLFILFMLFGYGAYLNHQDDKAMAEYIKQPQIGDVFLTKSVLGDEEHPFTLMKISKVSQEGVEVIAANYIYSKSQGKKALRKEVFQEEGYFSEFSMAVGNLNELEIISYKRD